MVQWMTLKRYTTKQRNQRNSRWLTMRKYRLQFGRFPNGYMEYRHIRIEDQWSDEEEQFQPIQVDNINEKEEINEH